MKTSFPLARRSFLKSLAATALASPAFALEGPPKKRAIKLGMDNFAVRAMGWKAPVLLDYAASLKLDTLLISDLDSYDSLDDAPLREVKKKASEMMATYLDRDADALDGFEFLTMAEAAEVGHWSVLQTMNESAGNDRVQSLVAWALPIQERHFQDVLKGSRKLAAEEDPNEKA